MTKAQIATNMKGDGYYDLHSQVQRNVIAHTVALLEQTAGRISKPAAGHPFTIVDYGCSEGGNSKFAVRAIIDSVRKNLPQHPILVVHNDLPNNNFNQLFAQIYAEADKPSATAYGSTQKSPVFVVASGQSFYDQVLPSDSVHFGFSFSSAHWTTSATPLKNHIYLSGATAQEAAEYAVIAAHDWLTFLSARTAELLPGGRMIVSIAARLESDPQTPQPRPESRETLSAQIMISLLNRILNDLVAEGWLDRKTVESYTLPIYARTRQELLAPCQPGAPLHGALEVEHACVEVIDCPLYERYKISRDAAGYAAALTGVIRAFTEPSLLRGLFGISERRRPERDLARGQRVLNEVYGRMQEAIAQRPDSYVFRPIQSTTVFVHK